MCCCDSTRVGTCVTLLLGDENHQVHLRGYQVSNQCMALVRDNCLLPCMDTPSLGYIKESSGAQFVPDVFFTVRAVYGMPLLDHVV